jgi:hypothetical protein
LAHSRRPLNEDELVQAFAVANNPIELPELRGHLAALLQETVLLKQSTYYSYSWPA